MVMSMFQYMSVQSALKKTNKVVLGETLSCMKEDEINKPFAPSCFIAQLTIGNNKL